MIDYNSAPRLQPDLDGRLPARNRHPVDELADIRAEMRRLKAREEALRASILAGECELVGDQFSADIKVQPTERVDVPALRKELGLERLKPFLRSSQTQIVRLTERTLPDDV